MKTGLTIELTEHICEHCQKPYIAKRTDAHYCSHSCRQLAYVQRRMNPISSKLPKKETRSNTAKLEHTSLPHPQQESDLSNELTQVLYRRNNVNILQSLLYDASPQNPSFWVSVRYKYLTECLLNLSETPAIYLNDLREVLSAFIAIQQSTYFLCLPFRYPYSKEIREFSTNLKSLCMTTEIDEPFRFELTKATKLQLMAIGSELEAFIPKSSYSQLSFTA